MDVTLLGTLGWMPRDARETTCFAVREGPVLFLFDAGTGLRRLLDQPHAALLDGASEVHLFLSHYHLDHVCGLAYLSGVLPGRELVLHPPAETLTGVDPVAAVSELVRRPYNPADLADMRNVTVRPAGRENEVAGHTIRLRPQQHTDTSVSFRLDDELVVATDTPPDPQAIAFARGAGLWLHEAWYWADDPGLRDLPEPLRRGYAAHSEATAVAGLAAEAAVGRLILVHLNPLSDESAHLAMRDAARATFPRTDVVDDGTVASTNAAV
ncbi:MAG: MBL fold metallo-hydrolase [Actinobacteria bacterium]|nr:MBL fold metallo-hydrolase [Actinomycetota bacterium]